MYEKTDKYIIVTCNKCGNIIGRVNHENKNGKASQCFEVVNVRHQFGYFSKRDGEIHEFDLCEECYLKIIEEFQIKPTINEVTEYL